MGIVYAGNKHRIHRLRAQGIGMGGIGWIQKASFEDGALTPNPTGWDATVGAGGTVNAASAYRGNYGYAVVIAPGVDNYGSFLGPANETYLNYTIAFNRNDLAMGVGEASRLITFQDGGGAPIPRVCGLQMANVAGVLYFQLTVFNDAGGQTNDFFLMPAGWNILSLRFRAADFGLNNGYVRLYVNGILSINRNNLDNDLYTVTEIRTGAHLGVDAGTSGTLWYDEAKWKR